MTLDLDAAIIAAHETGDLMRLVALYTQAAEHSACPDQCAFYLTHAHVFALESNHPDTALLRQRLIDRGREMPLP